MRCITISFVFLILFLGAFPGPAYAYVDPGLVTTLVQGVFALVFGLAVAWITSPWRYMKKMFRKLFKSMSREKKDVF